jgi:hypothetical protein
VLAERVAAMLAQLPAPLRREEASVLHDPFAALPSGRVNSLGMVLLQEMDRCALMGSLLCIPGHAWDVNLCAALMQPAMGCTCKLPMPAC